MTRSDFLRLSALAPLGFGLRGFALPEDYGGIPAGIRPYLQSPRPDSMWVSWWSDNSPSGHIDWGLAPDQLVQTVAADTDPIAAGHHYHAGRITGLLPSTYYYYKVRTSSAASDVFRFRTPPAAGTRTGRLRVLVLGDNQLINETRYEKLVACAKAKIESDFGAPIEEVVDFILMPGDQVDVGTLNHYRNLHFRQCGLVSPNVPVMTTVGNHETYQDPDLALYTRLFRYGDIDYAGLPGPEGGKYYAYRIARVAFIHSSSEHAGNVQKQWIRSLVDALKADDSTDLCVSVVHRPYQAEQYVGDISPWFRDEIMPMLAETEKHVLNIGAHHHLYARGQTREWPVYHIISGGTAWDQYWGQSNETDFDDVQKTIAHWAWQLLDFDLAERTMDVKCYAEANVRLPAATRWSYNSRLIDRFHRKLGAAPPGAPAITTTFDGPVTLPLELASSPFASAAGESLNSTRFQIANNPGFTNPRIDRIRDVENIYGDTGAPHFEPVDIHAGLDILRFAVASGLPNGTWHARVRHRDTNALWSGWSEAVVFEIEGSTAGDPSISLEKSVYAPDEDILVTYENGPGLATDWIGIYRKGQTPGAGSPSVTWQYVAGPAGTRLFTHNLPADQEYFAAFFTDDGYAEIAPRVPFFVGSEPVLAPGKAAYAEGETVRIDFSNAPGNPRDWIGLYRVGANPAPGSPSVQWSYVSGESGFLEFEDLDKGYYYAVYLVDDGHFEIGGRVRFQVGEEITQLSLDPGPLTAGMPFTVRFTGSPGIPKDWIGLYRQGESPGTDVLTHYLYFDGAIDGSVTFDLPDLPPGDYFVVMFTDDSYTEVSNRLLFTVSPAAAIELEEATLEGDVMRLRWKSQPGQEYVVERSAALGAWISAAEVVASGESHEVELPVDREEEPRCFFRVRLP